MTEEYKKRFDEIIKREKIEVEKYLEKHGVKPQIDQPLNKIYKQTGRLLKQLQDEYYGNKE